MNVIHQHKKQFKTRTKKTLLAYFNILLYLIYFSHR